MKDLKTEVSVLGSMLADPDLYLEAVDIIDVDVFTDTYNRHVYQSIEHLIAEGKTVTMSTVNDHIVKETGREVDVLKYLEHSSGGGFSEHLLILKEKQLARKQGELAIELSAKSNDPKQDPLLTNEFLLTQAESIVNLTTFSKPKTNAEHIKAVTHRIHEAGEFNGITGVRTGFKELDRTYGGRQKTDLIIKAGRPAMGKTSQALCEAKAMAYEYGQNVLFFSLEMGAEQLMQRLISVHTGIPLTNMRSGEMSKQDWDKYNEQVNDLSKQNLTIIDDVYSLTGIKTTAKKLKMRGEVDAIYIDYLQLIEHKVAGRNKENEVSEISRSLKMLAKSLDVPVVALSQLSRAVESRGGSKKPILSDLRDSGAIEQDADIVEFIYRPEYYFPDDPEHADKAYVIIAKNRNGACKDLEFTFNKQCTRFEDVSPEPMTVYKPMTEAMTNSRPSIEDDPF